MSELFGRGSDRKVEGADELRVANGPQEPPSDDAFFPDEIAREDVRPAELVEPEDAVGAPAEGRADAPAAEPAPDDPGSEEAAVTPAEAAVAPDEPAVEEPVTPAAAEPTAEAPTAEAPQEHAPGELEIPDGVGVFIGSPNGTRRTVGIAVSSFNGDITTRLLEGALDALAEAGVDRARVDVMRVPGAFELPLAAMALAKTRRYACVLALGCIIRGDTPHFEYIASEAASGIQLAALETGVPVSFGVLTCDSRMQAESRAGGRHGNKGAEAALSGLEMADVFSRLRADAVVADRR